MTRPATTQLSPLFPTAKGPPPLFLNLLDVLGGAKTLVHQHRRFKLVGPEAESRPLHLAHRQNEAQRPDSVCFTTLLDIEALRLTEAAFTVFPTAGKTSDSPSAAHGLPTAAETLSARIGCLAFSTKVPSHHPAVGPSTGPLHPQPPQAPRPLANRNTEPLPLGAQCSTLTWPLGSKALAQALNLKSQIKGS